MKQNLRLWMLTLLCAVFSSSMAETITFSTLGYENAQDVTEVKGDYATLTFSKGTGSNAPKYYNTGTAVRMYGGNTLTISSTKTISSVEFDSPSGNTISADYEFSTGSYSDSKWTGSATEIVLTNKAEKGNQWRFVSITVNYADGTVSKLNPGLKVNDVSLAVNKTAELSVTTLSSGALTFTPSDASIATVTASGGKYTVKALKKGTTSVNVSQAETSEYNSATTTFNINVYVEGDAVSLPYTVDFTSTQDQFTIQDGSNNTGTDIWKQSASYGMTATTYVNKTNNDGDSWLISPVIDLTAVSAASLTLNDQVNSYFGDITNEITINIREANGQWTKLNVTYTKPNSGWSGWKEHSVDLSAYAGKKVQIGFHYIGTATTAGTYEVKTFSVTEGTTTEKQPAGLSYPESTVEVTIGEDYTLPTLSNPNNLAVTFKSSNTDVATVDDKGVVTITGKSGKTTITATFAGDDNFLEGKASYVLNVSEKAVAGTDVYQLVTDASTLAADDQIIIVDEENKFALSTTQNTNNRAATAVALESDGTIIPSNLVQVITLEGETDDWYFNVDGQYLYAPSKSGNLLQTQDKIDEKASATITIDAEGNAVIQFNQWDEAARTLMRYNSSSTLFSCYAPGSTTGKGLRVYKNTKATVHKKPAELAYSASKYEATIGANNVFPTLSNPNNLPVTYESSKETVATINASGMVELKGTGTTTITASTTGNDNFYGGYTSYELTVKEAEVPLEDNGDIYELVTDASTLAANDIIIIVGENTVTVEPTEEGGESTTTTTYYGLSTEQKTNNRGAVEVTFNADGTITGNNKLQAITLEGNAGAWLFNVGNSYLYAASSGSNWLRTEEEADDNAKAAITITDNMASIIFQGTNTRNDLRFNYSKTNQLFACYGENTTQKQPMIFRKSAGLKGDANGDGEVDVTDLMVIANYILNKPNDKFVFKNADIVPDNEIDTTDLMTIVKIILKKDNQ